ncbi:TPA: hypothetical protein DCZ46_00665 [Candidatus Campbellbacteria bacterium]|nr:MAG: Protein of unknown function DUF955 [Candidatus Campbellbacteria bacterium GW2011_OD1_34_28]KKP75399.1 MAG: hypothetical protein UR74_C0001G0255 [Candidatus Campbellbacteria bacterium GW2011_GWD2_35_24]KKP76040.1 MAG: hypothetical protein UR75_C0001G0074 [Candidatus Campbellbacteria bacterium GW2011_GWC2_35_28]KKP77229.1 MAG: hypothetical protein UR76_C0001G0074 [Candidatus Campbellbacteria bacterium GW2011_GWC1_35_31]KKP79158.1 MAG: hypothetical protein UR79_C0001G0074 [Candidatus Campb
MKIRVTKKWNPLADTYQLTKQEIESQVLSDLAKYRQKYQEKYNKSVPTPIDVDNFVKELWDFDVSFEIIQQELETEETLGYLRPESRQIIVGEGCTNQKRISFTIAHESGHISLHGPLFSTEDGLITGWEDSSPCKNKKKLDTANIRREWQANVYAGTLLAPKIEVESFLQEIGLVDGIILIEFNLDDYFSKFEERFGLSRQALEIRLEHLKIPFKGSKYKIV